MAVPFSKPAYNAHYRARQARAQAQQQQQQQNQQHTITRFWDGNGGMRLDQLSLTSRIAFYALYEAYRLLVDLTNTNQQQNPQQQQQQPQHTVVNSPHAEQQHTAFWRIVWLHDDFHVNLTEFFLSNGTISGIFCVKSHQKSKHCEL